MFCDPASIGEVVQILEARNVSLWHACQLRDLDAYLRAGGVPSRQLLEQLRLPFTPFVTDAHDRRNGIWSKVFVNLGDFGHIFARGRRATPSPYGPIALQLRPTALFEADDVAICLRSAGASDFDRDVESLQATDEVERLFAYPRHAGVFRAMEPLFGDGIRFAFAPQHPNATSPEASLGIPSGRIQLSYLVALWVDPVELDGRTLLDAVRDLVGDAVPVRARWMVDDRRVVYGDLLRFLGDDVPPKLRLLRGRADVSAQTRDWAASLGELGLEWQFQRFARYLAEGTLDVLRGGPPRRVPTPGTSRTRTQVTTPGVAPAGRRRRGEMRLAS